MVNKVLDQVDIQPLMDKYKPGGTSSFHPRMLLKVLVFAYINNIYSSRKINEALKDKPIEPKVKQKLKYEQQEKIMGKTRSSYSKTDTDATFMPMKEDHMLNGQLKPAYNVQISTNNQFIASYSIHVKHNQFDRQQYIQSRKPFTTDKLYYNKEKDCYYCPMEQPMANIGTITTTTATGFKQHITRYQARNCEGCPLRGVCHKARSNRIIEVNHHLNHLKQKADELLLSSEGLRHPKQKPCNVEPVFGNIKNNHHFRRFMLRGIEKVSIKTGLLALAHNLRKKAAA